MADLPASLKDWSLTEGANEPAGTRSIANLDNNLRRIQTVVREMAAATTLSSASTTDLGSVDEHFITVTGTTTITAFGTLTAGLWKWVTFSGVLTLTHNGTSLILPGSANVTTQAGDSALFLSLGSGNWRCLSYLRADGLSVAQQSSMPDGTVSAPGLSFTSDPDNGLYRIGTNNWALAAGGTKVLEFTASAVSSTLPINLARAGAGITINITGVGNQGAVSLEDTSGVSYNGSTYSSRVRAGSASGAHFYARDTSSGTGSVFLFKGDSSDGSDTEFTVATNGTVSSDGGTSMTTPADYAEMFEWADGNPANEDRVGYSVALVGEKIKIAEPGDTPIGIVSGNPAVLGDAGTLRWAGKYLRDAFNRPVLDNSGARVLNPQFNPAETYVPRTQRKEWSPVGLMGKLRLRPGQVVSSRWSKMRDVDGVEEWLVI